MRLNQILVLLALMGPVSTVYAVDSCATIYAQKASKAPTRDLKARSKYATSAGIVYLTHSVKSLELLIKNVKNQGLDSRARQLERQEFGDWGTFMQLMSRSHQGRAIDMSELNGYRTEKKLPIPILLFDVSLLDRTDYHVHPRWYWGMKNEQSAEANDFSKLAGLLDRIGKHGGENEILFRKFVPFSALKKILVPSGTAELVAERLNSQGVFQINGKDLSELIYETDNWP